MYKSHDHLSAAVALRDRTKRKSYKSRTFDEVVEQGPAPQSDLNATTAVSAMLKYRIP